MSSRLNFGQSKDFQGKVEEGGNPRIHFDGGVVIEEMTLETNLAADEFTLVVEVDGEKRVEITGQELLDREAYDGRPATAGFFVLSFSDAMAKTIQGEGLTGLTTQPSQRVMISLEIADAVVEATPAATMFVETSPNRPEEFKLFILRTVVPVTSAGEVQFDGLRKGSRPLQNTIRRIFAYGAVSKLSIEKDRRTIFGKRELPKAVNDARLSRHGKTSPAACYVYDPILRGNAIVDRMDTFHLESLSMTFTTTDSEDINALVEYVQDVRPVAAA